MTLIEYAKQFRTLVEKAAQALDDADVLQMPSLLPKWEDLVEVAYTVEEKQIPFKFQYDGLPWKCIKAGQNFQAQWIPGLDTASIFTRIAQASESGTIDNPITAARGMEYEYGKYYLDPEDGKTYLCQRQGGSGTVTLNYLPHELVLQYFVEV